MHSVYSTGTRRGEPTQIFVAERYPSYTAEPWQAIAAFSERAYGAVLAQVERLCKPALAELERFRALIGFLAHQ
ncbi:MAG: hypothetical protein ACRDHE_10345 [Ktedonobacterales bacterium]